MLSARFIHRNLVARCAPRSASRLLAPAAQLSTAVPGPFIFVLLVTGGSAWDNCVIHAVMVVGFGALAYVLERLGFSAVPIIPGLVMGPIIEPNLNRAPSIAVLAFRRGQSHG